MRVLHIHNIAGVACVIAKFMDKTFNTESLVVMRKAFDRFGVTTYGQTWNCGPKIFTIKCLWLARKFDVIHVHDFDKIVPWLKRLYHNKPIILHYHGTRIRNRWKEREQFWSKADAILVSTPDLLKDAPKHAIFIPNPVDTDLFTLKNHRPKNTALYIVKHQEGEDLKWPLNIAENLNLRVHIHDRVTNPIPHLKLPQFLNDFEYYIDRNYVPSLSKTALEALACGLKVIDYNRELVRELPEQHEPQNVTPQLYKLYNTAKR